MAQTLSPEQQAALREIGAWYRDRPTPYLTLGGYAGTGKTTLIGHLRRALEAEDDMLRVAFCAYTGKASRVLANILREQKVLQRQDGVSTLHSLIYNANVRADGSVSWQRRDQLECDLIIIDEASMLDESLWQDVLSFGKPILAVGDHGQLPPVNSNFNLMASPVLRLEQVFRQQVDSPIIELATWARTTGRIPVGRHGAGVVKLDRNNSESAEAINEQLENWQPDLLIICGYNRTRGQLNQAIRQIRGYTSPEPTAGDRVVCLRNNRPQRLYNGLTGTIVSIELADDDPAHQWYSAEISLDGEDRLFAGYIWRAQFGAAETATQLPMAPDGLPGALFDFGYALTVHKAQGSQAEKVLLFEERFPRMTDDDWRRWLYTGVTRAQSELVIVGS